MNKKMGIIISAIAVLVIFSLSIIELKIISNRNYPSAVSNNDVLHPILVVKLFIH